VCDIVLFGGTTEGRQLAEFLAAGGGSALVCVATPYGAEVLSLDPPPADPPPGWVATPYGAEVLRLSDRVQVRVGRLDRAGIVDLLRSKRPRLVIDATHPYAAQASVDIAAACADQSTALLRIERPTVEADGPVWCADLPALVDWLNGTTGIVFVTLGTKAAAALTGVRDYAERLILRLLPEPAGMAQCAALGYPRRHLIAMQGPFSEALNAAMFQQVGAAILVTKESGAHGGLPEKLAAATACGLTVALLARPGASCGVSVERAKQLIAEVVA
jgi:precorrin-6x reductase